MPERDPVVAPPFDQGVFLLHYNRGREAFHEGRYPEARRELEDAQRLRPNDADVLNLLGLVYFKSNAFPEAEVIYRRLARDNPNVFILHSNLGLILFKQGKLEESEHFLLRAVELRPNYVKSHLYLGLLYKQKKKFGLAVEHLKFAGAEKVVRDVEAEMHPPVVRQPSSQRVITQRVPAVVKESIPDARPPAMENRTQPGIVPNPKETEPQRTALPAAAPPLVPARPAPAPPPALSSMPSPPPSPFAPLVPPPPAPPPPPVSNAGNTAARKLQEAVDETQHAEEKHIDLGRKIEGASKTFTLHENGFLEINFARSVHVKRGTVSSYSGNLKFVAESGLLGTTAQMLVKAVGQGKLFVYDKGRKTFLLDLNEEFIYVEGGHLLALEDTLTYRVEPIYDSAYERKIDTVKIFGKGSLAISTSIEPLTLRVTREYPLSISSNALVAWTGNVIPAVMDDKSLENIMIESEDHTFKVRFEGDGVVVSEQ